MKHEGSYIGAVCYKEQTEHWPEDIMKDNARIIYLQHKKKNLEQRVKFVMNICFDQIRDGTSHNRC